MKLEDVERLMEDSAEAQATQERMQEALSASLTPEQACGLPRCCVLPCWQSPACLPHVDRLQQLSPACGSGSGLDGSLAVRGCTWRHIA